MHTTSPKRVTTGGGARTRPSEQGSLSDASMGYALAAWALHACQVPILVRVCGAWWCRHHLVHDPTSRNSRRHNTWGVYRPHCSLVGAHNIIAVLALEHAFAPLVAKGSCVRTLCGSTAHARQWALVFKEVALLVGDAMMARGIARDALTHLQATGRGPIGDTAPNDPTHGVLAVGGVVVLGGCSGKRCGSTMRPTACGCILDPHWRSGINPTLGALPP